GGPREARARPSAGGASPSCTALECRTAGHMLAPPVGARARVPPATRPADRAAPHDAPWARREPRRASARNRERRRRTRRRQRAVVRRPGVPRRPGSIAGTARGAENGRGRLVTLPRPLEG